jgi:hypothetical protein
VLHVVVVVVVVIVVVFVIVVVVPIPLFYVCLGSDPVRMQEGKTALHTALDQAKDITPAYSSTKTFGFAELCSKLVEAGVDLSAPDKVRVPDAPPSVIPRALESLLTSPSSAPFFALVSGWEDGFARGGGQRQYASGVEARGGGGRPLGQGQGSVSAVLIVVLAGFVALYLECL